MRSLGGVVFYFFPLFFHTLLQYPHLFPSKCSKFTYLVILIFNYTH